jgi:hypothetical protein
MAIRHSFLFAFIIAILAFAVSSPRHAAFWIVLAAAVFVLGPYLFALGWLHHEARRLLRERTSKRSGDG